jgi:transposase
MRRSGLLPVVRLHVSRRTTGSKRRHKAVQLLKRRHQKIARQRSDFHHKSARSLLRTYDTIYLADVRVASMVRNHHLAKGQGHQRCRLGAVSFEPSSNAQQCMLANES